MGDFQHWDYLQKKKHSPVFTETTVGDLDQTQTPWMKTWEMGQMSIHFPVKRRLFHVHPSMLNSYAYDQPFENDLRVSNCLAKRILFKTRQSRDFFSFLGIITKKLSWTNQGVLSYLWHKIERYLLRKGIFTIRFSTEMAGALLAGVGATPNCERYRLKYSSFRKKQPYRISGSCTKVNLGTKNSGVNHENPIFL